MISAPKHLEKVGLAEYGHDPNAIDISKAIAEPLGPREPITKTHEGALRA